MSSKIDGVPREIIEKAMLACFEAGHGITHDELRALLAALVVERQDDSALMKIAADLANRKPLRQLYLVCERQGRISTDSLHEHLDKCGDLLAGIALDIRRSITAPPELAELQATIAQLESKLNNAINLDFERRAEIDRLKGGQGEPQVMGRVYTDDGITKCELNSIGRALPDHTPLYASQPAPASTASDIAQQLESVLAMFTPLDLTCNRALIEARACLDKVKELNQ